MAKKQKRHKKNKGNTDNSVKKRKREEQQDEQQVDPDPQPSTERPKKKHKKHKERHASVAEPDTLDELLNRRSPFVKQTTSFYLPLSPCAYHFPLEGLCAEHISPLLLTYYPPLDGVMLAYENARMSEHPDGTFPAKTNMEAKTVLSRSIDEYAVTYVWLTAEFVLFRPRRGTRLEGYVSLQNESMLALVCYNYFNAVIEKEKLPKDWRWKGDEDDIERPDGKKKKRLADGNGYFVNGKREKLEGRIVFRVEDFDASAGQDGTGTVSILRTLLSEGEDT